VLAAGAHPRTRIAAPGVEHAFLSEASEEQLAYLPPYALDEMASGDNTPSATELDNFSVLSCSLTSGLPKNSRLST